MEVPRVATGSISSSASVASHGSKDDLLSLIANPFELRHGRRYLRDLPYPLPCDLIETQRQNIRTLLGLTIFSKPSAAPAVEKEVPLKVLEVGCGCAYWSSMCHEWFATRGHSEVSFTGMDIAPLAPDLGRQGLNWRFVQHDIRRMPWPFEDEEFDYIMVKDLSLAVQAGPGQQSFMEELIRILKEGGTLEIWESDHVLRCLSPHPVLPPKTSSPVEQSAAATKTYLISASTPFAPAQNTYVVNSNDWIAEALNRLKLASSPCSLLAQALYQEADTLADVGYRRVAIPLGELHWEREGLEDRKHGRSFSEGNPLSSPKGRARSDMPVLTPDQAALRHTALLTVLQKIESLEPLLKEVSGKSSEEWSRWWAGMMSTFLQQENASSGEVLEVGAWWATKKTA